MKNLFICLGVLSTIHILNAENIDLDGKTIQLKSLASHNCIQVEGNTDDEGTKLIQYPCDNSNNQKLTFVKNSDDYYTISLNNGKKLTVASNSKSNGVNIVQTTEGNNFKIIKKGNGFSLQARHSKKFISTTSYNTDIVQEASNNFFNQLWIINSKSSEYYATCKEILDSGESIGDGVYTIDIDGEGDKEPFDVYCDMTNDGGGWTRIIGDLGTLSMNNTYLNQFMSNPEVNKLNEWTKNSDNSYQALANGCRDISRFEFNQDFLSKVSEIRFNVSGETVNQFSDVCTALGTFALYKSSNTNYFYYLLGNGWGSKQDVLLNDTYENTQKISTNYQSGKQIVPIGQDLVLSIGYKGTPRHIFDLSIR